MRHFGSCCTNDYSVLLRWRRPLLQLLNEKKNVKSNGLLTILVDDSSEGIPIDNSGNPLDLTTMKPGYYDLTYVRKTVDQNGSVGDQQSDQNGQQAKVSAGNSQNNQINQSSQTSNNSRSGAQSSMYDAANQAGVPGQASDLPDLSNANANDGKLDSNGVSSQASQIYNGLDAAHRRAQNVASTGNNDQQASNVKTDIDVIKQSMEIGMYKQSSDKNISEWKKMLIEFLKYSDVYKDDEVAIDSPSRRIRGVIDPTSEDEVPMIHRVVMAFDCSGSMRAEQWKSCMSILSVILSSLSEVELSFIFWANGSTVFNLKLGRRTKVDLMSFIDSYYATAKSLVQDGTDISHVFSYFASDIKLLNVVGRNKPSHIKTLKDVSVLLIFTDGEIADDNHSYMQYSRIKKIISGNERKIAYIFTPDAKANYIKQFLIFDPQAKSQNRIIKLTK